MRIPVTTDIDYAVNIICQGRLVAFPTGTSYGLAADGGQGFALQRLINLKKRPADKSFTVCLNETLWDRYLILNEIERGIMTALQGQRVTILLRPQAALAHLAQEGRVGVRLIDHPLMQKFIDVLPVPVTATSANISGQSACLDPACILATFPGQADDTTYDLSLGAILDGGKLKESLPSTIIIIHQDESRIEIVRSGALLTAKLQWLVASYGFTVVATV